ncbi:SDR family NAD(P)-dependent oxidoreductase [Sphingomonas sp. CD22]|uniref:SDR family NAD(P)-dependent oxidoreductase n=1 Tax=Sphingomonas sp. CD22 TaxID=3100214 RepID=UPI002ADF3B10|nr:SDR family NAD(P)-dependent oxidoreductase [Sphingomonas sp. CD22]MEA1086349.1 SDR family NAD(P)-dependent oxidoreductase [Sphingomonas sp. CD22]
MLPLDGRRAVLTGAAGGLGTLLAARLRAAGVHVTGIDRIAGTRCNETIVSDLADRTALAALADRLADRHVDILLNVAGLQYFGPIDEQGVERIALGYAVNLVAPAALAAAVTPQMIARGDGQIVNIGSVMGAIPFPYFTTYSSAKAGLKGLSQALRRELRGRGIAVTHVAPRAVRTGFNTPTIERFMALTKMTADAPDGVADRIVAAVERRASDISIGLPERLFAQLNALLPAVVDRGLAGQITAARSLFAR